MISQQSPLVLASSSPRRKELIELLHIPFFIHSVETEERISPGTSPQDAVFCLARQKAQASFEDLGKDLVYLGSDTIVVLDGQIFGKPSSLQEAKSMLQTLSGKTHQVYTGLCLLNPSQKQEAGDVCKSDITIAKLSEADIDFYLSCGESMDKAGAYGIQGAFAAFVPQIDGCYYNIMGLPLYTLRQLLQRENLFDFAQLAKDA